MLTATDSNRGSELWESIARVRLGAEHGLAFVEVEQAQDTAQQGSNQLEHQLATMGLEYATLQGCEETIMLENEQPSNQHTVRTASLESRVSELQRMIEELSQRLAEETELRLRAKSQAVALRKACIRREQQLENAKASRQRAESIAGSLTREIALLWKRVEAFRGLAQRESAARRKLEIAIKRSDDASADPAIILAIRTHIEVNERIRRLTTELTASRNHELSVRQRALREIKRAQEEVQQLKAQLASEPKAA